MIISLPDLKTCLSQTPWCQLKAIMACHGLTFANHYRKEYLIQIFYEYLINADVVDRIVSQLDGNEQTVLRALVQANGTTIHHVFERSYGRTREYRPWDKAGKK